jgi:hypothetical protein
MNGLDATIEDPLLFPFVLQAGDAFHHVMTQQEGSVQHLDTGLSRLQLSCWGDLRSHRGVPRWESSPTHVSV